MEPACLAREGDPELAKASNGDIANGTADPKAIPKQYTTDKQAHDNIGVLEYGGEDSDVKSDMRDEDGFDLLAQLADLSANQEMMIQCMNAYQYRTGGAGMAKSKRYKINSLLKVQEGSLSRELSEGHFSIVDSGADSMILRKGWKFTQLMRHERVDLMGFHENHARVNGCLIGTACTVMKDSKGSLFLIIAHNSIINEGSATSGLSE